MVFIKQHPVAHSFFCSSSSSAWSSAGFLAAGVWVALAAKRMAPEAIGVAHEFHPEFRPWIFHAMTNPAGAGFSMLTCLEYIDGIHGTP